MNTFAKKHWIKCAQKILVTVLQKKSNQQIKAPIP
jgi:hypothetical protein